MSHLFSQVNYSPIELSFTVSTSLFQGNETKQLNAELGDGSYLDVSVTRSLGENDSGDVSVFFTTFTLFFTNCPVDLVINDGAIKSLVKIAFPEDSELVAVPVSDIHIHRCSKQSVVTMTLIRAA